MDLSSSVSTFIGIGAVAAIWLCLLSMGLRSWWYVRRYQNRVSSSYCPSVALIAPCCGIDQGFEENIRAFLSQDYPDYRVIFVTATEGDPAYPIIGKLIGNDHRAMRLTAGISRERGQKVHNLLRGIEAAEGAEVLAFVDSDCRPHPMWLRSLVAPLADQRVGATTGYLWCRPERGGTWSWARAFAANLSVLAMAHGGNEGLWGGAMAIRRETFERARVAEGWQSAVSDDSVMSQRVRRLGLRLVFVPSCLTTVVEDCNFAGFYEFVKRHLVLVRACEPRIWWSVGGLLTLIAALLLVGVAALAQDPALLWRDAGALILLAQVPLFCLFGGIVLPAVFGDWRCALWWPLTPLIFAVATVAFAASGLTRCIQWRGVRYELISAERSLVLNPGYALRRMWPLPQARLLAMPTRRWYTSTVSISASLGLVLDRVRQGGWPWN